MRAWFAGIGSLDDQPYRVVGAAILGLACYEFVKSFFVGGLFHPQGVSARESIRYYQLHYTLGMFCVGVLTLGIMGIFWALDVNHLAVLGPLIFISLLGFYSFGSAIVLAFSEG